MLYEVITTIARLDKKDFEFKWEAVDIHQLIEEVSESIQLQVDKRGGELLMMLKAMNPIVTTDRAHCSNLIYNLLDNANKYSPDSPHIEVATRNTDKGVVIAITDRITSYNVCYTKLLRVTILTAASDMQK